MKLPLQKIITDNLSYHKPKSNFFWLIIITDNLSCQERLSVIFNFSANRRKKFRILQKSFKTLGGNFYHPKFLMYKIGNLVLNFTNQLIVLFHGGSQEHASLDFPGKIKIKNGDNALLKTSVSKLTPLNVFFSWGKAAVLRTQQTIVVIPEQH